ncbi:MAG: ribbon-helix-helix protein, CopG family [Chloroflexi bacterium]|nr:ribbon-helix-helix protein, CopG family [Chloroflexota bacterium]
MATIYLPEELVQKLEAIAQRQNRSVPDMIAAWAEQNLSDAETETEASEEEKGANWEAIFGIYDDDVTDMSTTVRETLRAYYEKKYSRPN